MVRDSVRVRVKVSVWVRFRVGILDTFRLLFRVRMRARVSVCFGELQ